MIKQMKEDSRHWVQQTLHNIIYGKLMVWTVNTIEIDEERRTILAILNRNFPERAKYIEQADLKSV